MLRLLFSFIALFSVVAYGNESEQSDESEEPVLIFIEDDVFEIDSKKQLNVGIATKLPEWDSYGYVMYCPCMGRFGNQAEHFLGALAFAKALNRTMVVPPWRTYRNVPYDDFFKFEELQKCHKVILMEDFIKHLAPSHWPVGKRHGYCWLPSNSKDTCKMKEGNPFGPFWDSFNVDFDDYVIYHMSSYIDGDVNGYSKHLTQEWMSQFPPSTHPVFAFKGAPAMFPVQQNNRQLHKCIKWSDSMMTEIQTHIKQLFDGESYVAIHLRNGIDWERACGLAEGRQTLMASPQCLEPGQLLSTEMCFPPTLRVLETTKAVVMAINAKHVYIATDHDPLEEELRDFLQPIGVKVHYLKPAIPQIDLGILGEADYFIGNCVSSFSSFVKRTRDTSGEDRPTTYWGFELE
ncbi:GDP-fucose protein O-fucosyltransferase 1-like [Glandiceps talaboti]